MSVTAQDLHWLKSTSQYRPKKGNDEYFSVSVLDRLISITTGLVPEPALCLVAGAAERSQETLKIERMRLCLFRFFFKGNRIEACWIFYLCYSVFFLKLCKQHTQGYNPWKKTRVFMSYVETLKRGFNSLFKKCQSIK